jgi:lipoprotein-anchoring transpeptidase ErfK/SrfK
MLALSGFSSGCQTNSIVQGTGDVTPNAVTGDAIEVTALDALPATSTASAAAPSAVVAAAGVATQTPEGAAPAPGSASELTGAAPLPTTAEATAMPETDKTGTETAGTEAAEALEDPEAEAAPPPPPKSELQIACERKRGTWENTDGGLKVCIRQTRDGGKRCTRESQCEGLCLARSGTCAPVQPLLGCHDILQDDGTRATQCLE